MVLLTLFCFFIGIIVIQFFYFVIVFRKFAFAKTESKTLIIDTKKVSVSVIVCAKNEAENVKNFIPILAEQDYKNFEIILIDDASNDQTLEIYEAYEKQYSNIKIVRVENNEAFWGNKKFALTMGIKATTKDYLLFIDADCYPNSKSWITEMSANFTTEKTIVLGYGAYQKIQNSFLNKIIRFETLFTAMQYFGWAKNGNPYMGVGRNLAYKKSEFFRVNGYINHMKIKSGDDDLFINEAANTTNTAICVSETSFTTSKPKMNFSDWFDQKRRHISTAKHYKFFDKFQLSLFYLSQIMFFIVAIILFVNEYQWVTVFGLVGFRYVFTWIIVSTAAEKLDEKDVIIWYPIMEMLLIIIQLQLFVSNIFSKPSQWK
jgi:glycosyltransferase involved in cell wall biosynthesis